VKLKEDEEEDKPGGALLLVVALSGVPVSGPSEVLYQSAMLVIECDVIYSLSMSMSV